MVAWGVRENSDEKLPAGWQLVPIQAPPEWAVYPGAEPGGLVIPDDETRWLDQDMWGARTAEFCLDIGTYGEEVYVCNAHAPDWHGRLVEIRTFAEASKAAAWAEWWMKEKVPYPASGRGDSVPPPEGPGV